jgi:hypothetical protein
LIAVVVLPVPPFWFEIAIVGIFHPSRFYLLINKTTCVFNTLTTFCPVCKREWPHCSNASRTLRRQARRGGLGDERRGRETPFRYLGGCMRAI